MSVALSVTSTGVTYQSLSPSGSTGSSACVVVGGVVSPPSSQLSASTTKLSKATFVAGPAPSCLTNRPILVTPFGPYALTGTGGACCVNVAPSYEYSVMMFVPS